MELNPYSPPRKITPIYRGKYSKTEFTCADSRTSYCIIRGGHGYACADSNTSYGKISCGCGIFKQSYEGKNPVRNYAAASAISVGFVALTTVVVTGIPPIVKYQLKKWGIIEDKDKSKKVGEINNLGDTPTPIPKAKSNSFRADVERAVRQGPPKNILSPEILKGSRLIIFSGAGVGKSTLVSQMAIGIGSGKPCGVFPDEVRSTPQNVLLIDTEQEDTDLYLRYSNGVNHIPETIERVSDCSFNSPEEVAAFIQEKVNEWTTDGTVVLDNITSAFSLQSGECIRLLFNHLKSIQNTMKAKGVTITYIIVCHEKKSTRGIALKDIQGSANLGNFATAVYGLEKAGEEMVRLKVLKNRRSPNVGKSYLEKLCADPYLHFEFQGVSEELENAEETTSHLSSTPSESNSATSSRETTTPTPNGRKLSEAQQEEMRRLYLEGASINQLHKLFGVNRGTVKRYLGQLH